MEKDERNDSLGTSLSCQWPSLLPGPFDRETLSKYKEGPVWMERERGQLPLRAPKPLYLKGFSPMAPHKLRLCVTGLEKM